MNYFNIIHFLFFVENYRDHLLINENYRNHLLIIVTLGPKSPSFLDFYILTTSIHFETRDLNYFILTGV